MQQKRVVHVCPYLHPRAGGPAILVPAYCSYLPELGWQVSVLTTDWYSPGGSDEIKNRYPDLDITVLETGDARLRLLRGRDRETANYILGNADVIHMHGLWHTLGWMVRKYSDQHAIPYVLSPHGMLDPYSMDVGKIKKRIYFGLVEKKNLQHAKRILYTTDAERDKITLPEVHRLKSEVILLGSDDPPDQSRTRLAEEFLCYYPLINGRKIILFFGRLHEKKGLHDVIAFLPDILEKVPDAMLLIVGDGEMDYINRINADIMAAGIQEHVLFTGLLEGEEKWAALAAADVMVLPSRQENFALAVAETMKMETPVIISDKVDICACVKDANAGMVLDIDDYDPWIDAIVELLIDDNKRQMMGENSGKLAREAFTWSASTEKLAGVYNTVYEENCL